MYLMYNIFKLEFPRSRNRNGCGDHRWWP